MENGRRECQSYFCSVQYLHFFLTLKLLSHKCNLPACHAVCFQLHFVWPYGILSGTDTCTIAKATECTSFIVQRMVGNEVSSRVVAVELWFNLPIQYNQLSVTLSFDVITENIISTQVAFLGAFEAVLHVFCQIR